MCLKLFANRKPHKKDFSIGDTIETEASIYKLYEYLGRGAFGKVYKCLDKKNNRNVALKLQKFTRSWMETETWDEIKVLLAVNQSGGSHFCELIDYGILQPEDVYRTTFMVMTLLGPNLSKLAKEFPFKHFTLSTALRVGIQTLEAISELHRSGYVSRDIKPQNFAIGTPEYGTLRKVFMFDFGLACRYRDKTTGKLLKMDVGHGVGTPYYVSIPTHMGNEYARRDDLESWFYMLVHLTKGFPWKLPEGIKEPLKKPPTKREQEIVLRCFFDQKMQARLEPKVFLVQCPIVYEAILLIIDEMRSTANVPPYDHIIGLLQKNMTKNHRMQFIPNAPLIEPPKTTTWKPKMKEELKEVHKTSKATKEIQNKPKRPKNPFFQFSDVHRPNLLRARPELQHQPSKVTVQELSKLWAETTPEEREFYQELAKKDKERYEREQYEYEQTGKFTPLDLDCRPKKEMPTAPAMPHYLEQAIQNLISGEPEEYDEDADHYEETETENAIGECVERPALKQAPIPVESAPWEEEETPQFEYEEIDDFDSFILPNNSSVQVQLGLPKRVD